MTSRLPSISTPVQSRVSPASPRGARGKCVALGQRGLDVRRYRAQQYVAGAQRLERGDRDAARADRDAARHPQQRMEAAVGARLRMRRVLRRSVGRPARLPRRQAPFEQRERRRADVQRRVVTVSVDRDGHLGDEAIGIGAGVGRVRVAAGVLLAVPHGGRAAGSQHVGDPACADTGFEQTLREWREQHAGDRLPQRLDRAGVGRRSRAPRIGRERLQCRIARQIDIDRQASRDMGEDDPARFVAMRIRIGRRRRGCQPPSGDAAELRDQRVDARVEQHPAACAAAGVIRDRQRASASAGSAGARASVAAWAGGRCEAPPGMPSFSNAVSSSTIAIEGCPFRPVSERASADLPQTRRASGRVTR